MNLNPVLQTVTALPARLKQRALGMFNLNDPRWGRDDDKTPASSDESKPAAGQDQAPPANPPQRPKPQSANQGPPDLDELWRDFNRKLGGIFGGNKGGANRPQAGFGGGNGGGPGGFQPDMKAAGVGAGLIGAVAVLIWLGTGFFIVQEGQQAVITQFGKYNSTVGAGFNWRLPYPVQRHEVVVVSQIRSVDVGRDTIIRATGLRESAMLTIDENIVEIKFAVQYRLSDARAFLFETRDPAATVVQAAETAVREVVGKMTMDSALAEERDQIGPRVRVLMQTILDRYKVGVEVVAINLQQSGVRPPEQVQAAFDDVLRAGQERERAKNEAQAYANDVVPRATGSASRLQEESEAYKARVVAQSQGDAQRFRAVLTEYQKAPQVTRDRMYTDAMQQVYSNVTKVLVDSKQGSNLLYLPLDKLMQANGQGGTARPGPESSSASVQPPMTPAPSNSAETRARDTSRTR
ncbi:MAG: FtsH protease activity modulator HflK [Polaromonas sp.]|jgi:membrane protease subunit HflK